MTRVGPFAEEAPEHMAAVIDTNLKGAMHMTRAVPGRCATLGPWVPTLGP
jgi:NADP-dependent 3-hydroxy acid dehydrogenase YdfG